VKGNRTLDQFHEGTDRRGSSQLTFVSTVQPNPGSDRNPTLPSRFRQLRLFPLPLFPLFPLSLPLGPFLLTYSPYLTRLNVPLKEIKSSYSLLFDSPFFEVDAQATSLHR